MTVDEGFVTAVVDDPNTAEMAAILESIRQIMLDRILSPDIEEKYAEAA